MLDYSPATDMLIMGLYVLILVTGLVIAGRFENRKAKKGATPDKSRTVKRRGSF